MRRLKLRWIGSKLRDLRGQAGASAGEMMAVITMFYSIGF
jgi:hypothetical protein